MRSRSLLPFLPVLILIGLVGALAGALVWNIMNVPEPLVGRDAPAFDLPELRNPEARFASTDMLGQPALLNVWASWCVTCRQEHQTLVSLERMGIPVFGLNFRDSREQAVNYLSRGGDPFSAIGFDPNGRVSADWGVHATPVTFLVDRHGQVRFKHVGPLRAELVRRELIPLYRQLEAES
ncbi:Cytochrome c-type biogenesis protein CcmG/DsbE, thiol:disulfide oxidoreductase [Thioalkalivibrio nitratireducens DSM 14787]|uniref:Cytochrome c-type biogenesis protein CcmG/DsbE, thiol:disulfide oxidoreductase n=1 Tax=Thioalkalivibrio nitratireducens (strain DSM 14787 / UNIQEM 213 / ALEN2) TaxID=1255043 RepID=L0DSM1_THIND|nr:DsbE family thiol:disulfide interchange protein [Thioalkalivibrio nitratireducens]AGA31980.1 Cytochrome c-type biogenesis protein CcmG/DsbE, thiol:disulfide oxidoreductase [Thioalkalivibrio nitratireducens DSM 14787]